MVYLKGEDGTLSTSVRSKKNPNFLTQVQVEGDWWVESRQVAEIKDKEDMRTSSGREGGLWDL